MPTALPYIGRFAPSPSGPLHFGSLIAALASYLDARANSGQWLVRIEDIDPPREQSGAAEHILHTLKAHRLTWDGPVLFQSQRHDAYRAALDNLKQLKLIYPCSCTRQRLKSLHGIYDGHCLNTPPADNESCALRLKIQPALAKQHFDDLYQGALQENLSEKGDSIIHRKDGLFAYQLAVVVDDIKQGVTHIIRGKDLLDCSAQQQYLFQVLGKTPAQFGHIPLALAENGLKLSKQNHAPALDNNKVSFNLQQALTFLGIKPPTSLEQPEDLLSWATQHWPNALTNTADKAYTFSS